MQLTAHNRSHTSKSIMYMSDTRYQQHIVQYYFKELLFFTLFLYTTIAAFEIYLQITLLTANLQDTDL